MLALNIENLSKYYRVGSYNPLQDMKDYFTGTQHNDESMFWALKDINFKVDRGEILGITGHNGAGKSTLLKILSRITWPSAGSAKIYASLASLLEVGTGFHPELTGRENVYMNGSILGMKRHQIRARFDEIVEFAGVERFIDTPIKRYSSGMKVRLAFAVAAHLNPEILLIDEVLSVGDVPFQQKCLQKMDNVAKEGRTVIFVSHNLGMVKRLCPRSLLIDGGKLVEDGKTEMVLDEFHKIMQSRKTTGGLEHRREAGLQPEKAHITEYHSSDINDVEKYVFETGETIRIQATIEVGENVKDLMVLFALQSEVSDETITSSRHSLTQHLGKKRQLKISLDIPNNCLMPRDYLPYLWVGDSNGVAYDRVDYYTSFCTPFRIKQAQLGPSQIDGFFYMPTKISKVA